MFTFRLTAALLLAFATLSSAGPLDQKQIGPVRVDKAAILAAQAAVSPVAPPSDGGNDRERPSLDDELVWSEGFENTVTGFLPSGWMMIDEDGGFCNQWNRQSTFIVFDYGQQNSHTGLRCALVHYNDAAANSDWLISPVITAGSPLTLHYWAAAQDPSYPERWEVRVSTTGRNVGDFTNIVETVENAPALWIRHSVDLTPFAGQSFYIAWHYNSTNQYLFKLDDIDIEAGDHGPAGDITGIVRYDRPAPATDRPLEGATVTIVETGVQTVTLADGSYALRFVAPGTYSLSVMHPDYTTLIVPNIVINTGQNTDSTDLLVFDANRDSVRVYYLGTPAADISDFDTARVNFNVTRNELVYEVIIEVNLLHTWVGDLDIWLRSPGGETVQLFRNNVNLSGDDMLYTRFTDQATALLSEGQPPFTGAFRPYQALANFAGDPAQGTWTLLVYDGISEDFGSMLDSCKLVVWHNSAAPLAADDPIALPLQFEFAGNYPNPFNPSTTFEFTLGQSAAVNLSIYNLLGEQVATVVDDHLTAGTHRIEFDGSNLSSGVFFAKLTTPQLNATRKIVLLK